MVGISLHLTFVMSGEVHGKCPPQARPPEFNFTANARRRRDHRNSISRQMPAAGATTGFNFTANARRRRDHRNPFSRQMSAAGATGGIPFHGNTHRRWGATDGRPHISFLFPLRTISPPEGQTLPVCGRKKRGVRRKCRHRHTLIRARSVLRQPNLLLRMRPCLRHGRTPSTAGAVPLPLATLWSSIKCGRLCCASKFYVNITKAV